jgi:hypothetical protein
MSTKIIIELNEKQEDKFKEWKRALKVIFGEVGTLTWTIVYNGIGPTIYVHSSLLINTELELTDVNSW